MHSRPAPATAPRGGRQLRLVPELLQGNRLSVGAAVVLALAGTAATLALPLLIKRLVETLATGGSLTGLLALMVPLALGSALAAAASGYLLARAGERLVLRLRSRVMEHTLRLPLPVVRTAGPGDLVARVTSDAMLLRSVIDMGVVQLPVAVITALGTLVMMALLDWVLVLLTLAAFAVVGVVIWVLMRRVRRGYEAIQTTTGALAQRFTATLTALATVKSCRAELRAAQRLSEDAGRITAATLGAARLQSLLIPVMVLGQEAALAAVVIGGGSRITDGDLTLADFIAYILYLLQLVTPITVLVTGVSRLQTGLAARTRFEELLATDPESDAVPAPTAVPGTAPLTHAVAFADVDFAHPGGPDVLRSVSFRVPARGLTAIVGASGAGKSTALQLIERFIAPSAGTVEVLGRPVERWPLGELRGRIAYVDQACTLIEGTVRENLLLGSGGRGTDAELQKVLAVVGLDEDVARLPEGVDTLLGRATDLSGGQRQRIALARALLSDADLVLLDEPTSQLDGLNELRLRNVVDALAENRAVLVVAHRLSTVQGAAHVIMMDAGRVEGAGSHEELLERSPAYRELVESQQSRRPVPVT
ncbi:ABC transporter ATP-binding protein [Streptomyces bacillaris]|uniref:ABC transporter ATP-binding protein n=1 Tax=Streptomyces TaxID=1883 RepID=UPI0006AD0D24|nr:MULTISPECIES: ABC transporter ATP-binding protein [Streptomyces]ALC29172.1 hypothetical protein ABE83_20430 [Streptomyces sp. CFMR 7]MBT3077415.1 ABC transporter ATP-binding protein/permease [Streptomyces sp. COG21]MBT3082737.1 ABC transporter ATP-binding protein/permease [Streptomyces sp. COG20]MBT3087558.1 ABC transporter ATP-binding protein/permease [Streptomyces sp. CYG21]MBT3097410.1 ABC transporter ATP-binding protein/permease [Streptomyces sp. CBG30]